MKETLASAVVLLLLAGCHGNPPNVQVRMQPLTPDLIEARDRGLRPAVLSGSQAGLPAPMDVGDTASETWADDPRSGELACYASSECRTTAHGLGV